MDRRYSLEAKRLQDTSMYRIGLGTINTRKSRKLHPRADVSIHTGCFLRVPNATESKSHSH